MENISKHLRILLDLLGMKQSGFARKMEISPAHVSKLLRGGNISPALIIAISCVFKVERRWLETGEGEMFQPPEGIISETDFQEFVTLFKKDLSRIIDRNEELVQENIRLRNLLAENELKDADGETRER